jgi:hypothetical protein
MPGPGPSPILPAGPRQTPAGTRTRQARIRDHWHGMMTRTATVTATRAVTIRVTGTVTVDYEKLDSVTSSHYYDAARRPRAGSVTVTVMVTGTVAAA